MDNQVSFPVAWHSAILGLSRPLADGGGIEDVSQSALRGAAFGLAHLPRGTQVTNLFVYVHVASFTLTNASDSRNTSTTCLPSACPGPSGDATAMRYASNDERQLL